tara:strand:- start:81 stop:464 length:384 start_codon:yes stop_codon:yes gene_type:complete
MNKKLLICLIIFSLGLYFSYRYIYQEHRNIYTEDPKYILTSDSLFNHFSINQKEANQIYINQIIRIKGVINTVSENQLILYPGIVCLLDNNFEITGFLPKDTIELKGRCVGFDDLFFEVKIDQTTLY